MPRTKPAYAPELRQRILDLARAGRTPASLAREFEPTETTIRNWVVQAARDAGVRTDALTTDERKELNELRREVRTLREERDILPLVMSTTTKRFLSFTNRGRRFADCLDVVTKLFDHHLLAFGYRLPANR